MITLPESLNAWNTPEFETVLKRELARLGGGQAGGKAAGQYVTQYVGQYVGELPLQQGLSVSSYALDEPIQVLIQRTWEEDGRIHARVGVFYSGLIAGCSCADDPTPTEAQNEYCELLVAIDRTTAAAEVTLLRD